MERVPKNLNRRGFLSLCASLAASACSVRGNRAHDEADASAQGSSEQEEASEMDGENMMGLEVIREIPDSYKTSAEHQGEVVRFDYSTSAEDKYALVYLPYGYSDDAAYDIVYLMHGGGGSQQSLFDGAGSDNDMKRVIDHLIENGEMRPVIIVAPTFYTQAHASTDVAGSWDAVLEFPAELQDHLMPAVEEHFATYATSTDPEGFAASRAHRAFGGFSMGSVTTWYVFQQQLAYFATFIPISGDCWSMGMQGGGSAPEATAQALTDSVTSQGYGPDDFRIVAMTGSQDIAEPYMSPQVEAMRALDETFTAGNLTYLIKEGGVHSMPYVKEYLYNILPTLYAN